MLPFELAIRMHTSRTSAWCFSATFRGCDSQPYDGNAMTLLLANKRRCQPRLFVREEHWDERVVMEQSWSDYLDQIRSGAKILQGSFRKPPNAAISG